MALDIVKCQELQVAVSAESMRILEASTTRFQILPTYISEIEILSKANLQCKPRSIIYMHAQNPRHRSVPPDKRKDSISRAARLFCLCLQVHDNRHWRAVVASMEWLSTSHCPVKVLCCLLEAAMIFPISSLSLSLSLVTSYLILSSQPWFEISPGS